MCKLYGVGFGFDIPNYILGFFVMILIPKPPSRSAFSIKKIPIWLLSFG